MATRRIRTTFALLALGFIGAACGQPDRLPPPDDKPPPSFPIVELFEADPPVLAPGATTTLKYRVSSADTVTIEPGVLSQSPMLAGEVQVGPLDQDTTYTLIARSAAGDTRQTIVVSVGTDEVQIVSFTAEPAILEPGGSSTLRWQTTGATAVRVAVQGGAVLIDQAPAAGEMVINPTASTTYEIVAEGKGGPKSATAQVLVGTQPRIISFAANPAQITGGSSTLSWQVENATSVEIRDGAGTTVVANGPLTGMQAVSPTMTTMYMLVATGAVGSEVASVTVTVLPPGSPRVLEFTVAPASLPGPGMVTVTWNTADADTVDLHGNGTPVAVFPRTPSGTVQVMLAETTTLQLRAENGQGLTTEEMTINVGTPDTTAPTIQHTPSPSPVIEGTAFEVDATITDADSGIATATLFYRLQGAMNYTSVTLVDQGNDRYTATIPAAMVTAPAVQYYIQASDGATPANAATDPTGAPATHYTLSVRPNDQTAPAIVHTVVPADQQEGTAVTVNANVTDATGIDSVQLFYKRSQDTLFTSVTMNGSGGAFSAQIPAAAVLPPSVDYYIEATDTVVPANVGREPATAPGTVHTFSVLAIDRTPPAITHTPIANGQVENSAVTVTADVTDGSGVGSVTLHYRVQGAPTYSSVVMAGATTWVAQIPAASVQTPGVEYYIEAVDVATPTTNTARVPAGAPGTPYVFAVSMVDTAPPTISHLPVQDGQRPNQPLTLDVDIADGSGVSIADLRYRQAGAMNWTTVPLAGTSPNYTGTIPAGAMQGSGIEYYFEAADGSMNVNVASLPANAPTTVFSFTLGIDENEPNNTSAQATAFLSQTQLSAIALGGISPASDRDFFIVDVPAATGGARYNVTAEITNGGVGACGSIDTRLRLYANDGTTVLVSDDLDGVGSCSRIQPSVDTGARALAAGRYYLAVEEDGQNSTITNYELRGSLTLTACGNSILESGANEQCDDGNTTAGDGCSATCQLETVATFNPPMGSNTDAISPAGDADLYRVVVPAGYFLTAEVSDGSNGCNGDTVMELYDTNGTTQLGSDDDGGPGLCSRIDPVADSFAANMAAGTYFIRVRGYSASTVVSSYTLTVTVQPNVCGNNAIETSEQCDDGNSTSGDGCSSTCQWETAGTASGMGASFMGSITPAGNVDWYAVTVPAGYSVRAETLTAEPATCSGADTVMRFWQADRTTQIMSDDDGGVDRCSLLNPVDDTLMRNLAAGTYYVSVEEYGNNGTIASYVLNVAIQAPVCGDGYVSGAETCDDGNTMAGDGCSATCAFEGTGESEPNGTTGTADVLLGTGTSATIFGVLSASNDTDMYSVVVPAGMSLFAEVVAPDGGCPVDNTLRLRSPSGTSLVSDTSGGPDSCGRISPGADSAARALTAGTYYLEVTGDASNQTYQLNVVLMTPGCGDMYLSGAETCDDGNTTAGDGCSATCTLELSEMEPNATSSAALSLGTMRTVSGDISPAGDEDWYSVTVPANSRIGAHSNGGSRDQCNGVDTILEVYDTNGTMMLASDDSGGPSFCSSIFTNEAGVLPAGTYFIRVRGYRASDTFPYVLMLETP